MDSMKVLLVDDEKKFIENIANLLEKRNYQTTVVYNGEDAVDALRDNMFDVVIMDLKMPGMDGIATMKKIKELDKSPEFLMLTGHGSVETALKAVEMGAYDYIAKPCELDELIVKIEEIALNKNNTKKKFRLKEY